VTVYLTKSAGSVVLMARAENSVTGTIGDLVIELHPGESALGKSYAEWDALPEGRHEID
jgi:hypothetical protein